MHEAQQPRTLEQGLVQGQLNLPGPQSEQDPHVSGWDITQEETTQLIMEAGGINEYNWGFTDEEITQIINAHGVNEYSWEVRPETVPSVEPGGVEDPGANL
jgi:hypothetical protein